MTKTESLRLLDKLAELAADVEAKYGRRQLLGAVWRMNLATLAVLQVEVEMVNVHHPAPADYGSFIDWPIGIDRDVPDNEIVLVDRFGQFCGRISLGKGN